MESHPGSGELSSALAWCPLSKLSCFKKTNLTNPKWTVNWGNGPWVHVNWVHGPWFM